MDTVKISYLAAGFVKNELVTGHLVTVHTIGAITVITVYDKDMKIVEDHTFRDVFHTHRKKNQVA